MDEPENATRGNKWEIVSLTKSAYAAARGSNEVDLNDDEKSRSITERGVGTSNALFMSRRFVFPPSQHENLPLEPEKSEIHKEHGGENGDAIAQSIEDEEGKSDLTNQEKLNIEGLAVSDEFPRIPIFDDNGNILSVSGIELKGNASLQESTLVAKEQSFDGAVKSKSIQNEQGVADESFLTCGSVNFSDQGIDSGFLNLPKNVDEDEHDRSNPPREAWWKKQATSLYVQAKEANAFWSIFVAAAVMGLVILGQHWQHER